MKKIISILMAFALVFNLFGKSFGNNQKLQKNVDETNIYENHLNKKTQKMNIKAIDALSKKLVYADSIDLSNIDEEKILKDIQEYEEENLEIFETEDDELKDKQFYYYLEKHKARRTNKTYKSWIKGYSYRTEKILGKTYWIIGERDKFFGSYNEIAMLENDKTSLKLNAYIFRLDEMKAVENGMLVAVGGTILAVIAYQLPKLSFLAAYDIAAFASIISSMVAGAAGAVILGAFTRLDTHAFHARLRYGELKELYMEQIKYPQSGS